MKTILSIGHSFFLAPDASTAAKVADLLGTMTRIEERYVEKKPDENGSSYALIQHSDCYYHLVKIEDLNGRKIFESKAEFEEWEAKHASPTEGGAE